ncbi:MAG: 3-phosphoshikimate 1-carboxyvinyltransferase [Clostridiales bacterium]|nr:3-phosphoshikimate 1-carboxyvinyltransferase [Candidatus Crickella equi]
MSSIVVDCKKLKGEVIIPASKSILHRYLICSYLDDDYDAIRDVEKRVGVLSDDVRATRDCLLAIIDGEDKDEVLKLNCHESGTTLRFMVPLVAAMGLAADVIAEDSLVNRPMKAFTDELEEHGAVITDTMSEDGKSRTFHVEGKLEEGDYMIPGNISSQFISGLMLASDKVEGDVWVCIEDELQSSAYVDMTEKVIKAFDMGRGDKVIEGDWSNGAMWVVANDILGGRLKVKGLASDSIQGDRQIIDILNEYAIEESIFEMYGDEKHPRTVKFDVSDCPDLAPVIALRAVKSGLVTVIDNASRLKKKECDRLQAINDILFKLGADIHIGVNKESLVIRGTNGESIPGTDEAIDTYGDHRMVMLATMASLLTNQPVKVDGAEAISKSYPTFFEDIKKLGGIAE